MLAATVRASASSLRQRSASPARKRAWSNWVPALRGQRCSERATSGYQARVGPLGALDRNEEGVDLATPSSREMHMLKGSAVERSEVPRNAYKL
jgi:hypothetical protein